ncbi:ornithine cyclodeaminase family protein [Vibrio sp. ZSDZ65]|uniref:Ornithine cyclodeaminase family protein n=1 Tax=Vibrio qingdaonensis TaxID=2829491 RepID=A0A9X3CR70_9VIBR|nr:ornithine cyclodeaminase family protein [Vibrio qingdaonensis]MCW8347928.1 ornithine cyclodeaminase family protein [Vibrio qingdaonensis]
MDTFESEQIERALSMSSLISAMRHVYAQPATVPQRNVMHLSKESDDALALLPAWNEELIAVKAFTYFPSNISDGKDVLSSRLLAFRRQDGAPLASMDAKVLTYWRTAAASALAADYLARSDADTLLICGNGHLAAYFAWAYAAIRPLKRVLIWGRDQQKSAMTAEKIVHGAEYQALPRERQYQVSIVSDVEQGLQCADMVSCVTGSPEPLFKGEKVRAGTHVDLVGNHHRDRRECDTQLVLRSKVYVDSRINVLSEAGELLIPIAEGEFSPEQIIAELPELCSGKVLGRGKVSGYRKGLNSQEEITLYKSVGSALADLAAAHVVLENSSQLEVGA